MEEYQTAFETASNADKNKKTSKSIAQDQNSVGKSDRKQHQQAPKNPAPQSFDAMEDDVGTHYMYVTYCFH